MDLIEIPLHKEPLRQAIRRAYRQDETEIVDILLKHAATPAEITTKIKQRAYHLVEGIRQFEQDKKGIDAFVAKYDLSSEEGIAMMCLAEALLRIPDKATIDQLISDKIGSADWEKHLGQSDSTFVNLSTWALMLTGKVVVTATSEENAVKKAFRSLIKRGGEPVIRTAVKHAMKIMGQQYVMGETIEAAIERAKSFEEQGYRYSYDMLGEAAYTQADADRYFKEYTKAIEKVAQAVQYDCPTKNPGISVKLSALHPRYRMSQYQRVINELTPRLLNLAQQAKAANIALTVDAEEADRLELSLDIIEKVFTDPSLDGWEGFGLAVQSYQKRAFYVIDWLIALARKQKRRLMLRLIKGAYWDSEIKISQVEGLVNYPVFTRKKSTDVSYLACAKKILAARDAIYCMFGTHNAYSAAAIIELAGENKDYEFQCLHGMGQSLYNQIVSDKNLGVSSRVYAPVGSHNDLLPYLVRRLLENGANTSFVNRIKDAEAPIDDLIKDPVEEVFAYINKPHTNIPLPERIFAAERLNSLGMDLSDIDALQELNKVLEKTFKQAWSAAPITGKKSRSNQTENIVSPINQAVIANIVLADSADINHALDTAKQAQNAWNTMPVDVRASCLEKAADLLQESRLELMALLAQEAGKTIPDAVAEIREAIDFCRYYAVQARKIMQPIVLPGATGEYNELSLHGRGVIVCISPWNFPLAIFLGQITAALVTGNAVIAKPAEQTPLIAARAIQLLHQAGIPEEVLHYLPGKGETVGAQLVADVRISGVIFTGSVDTARKINQSLANRPGPIAFLIAETGGQNTMIVDSSALLEQVCSDVLLSAFGSAGQRCSALRVLFIQEDVAERFITMLRGAMAELNIGDPRYLHTDVGPLIDADALKMLQDHFNTMQADKQAKFIYQVAAPKETGYFFGPCAFEVENLSQLDKEIFGPFLHVISYKSSDLEKILTEIHATGYGLTQGIHSRINYSIDAMRQQLQVGNLYINRNIIGAVVGVQPFGGEGLSGTGPKAGGPHYLPRLCVERTVTINTTAAGGNASLLMLQEGL